MDVCRGWILKEGLKKLIQIKHMFDIWGKSYEKLTWRVVYDNIIYPHMYINEKVKLHLLTGWQT